ncbi:MAG: helix-turn-helix domain-containing protein [Boseongicola sp.]
MSYRDLVPARRLGRSQTLLKESGFFVNRIALEVGYSSAPQFNRAFKAFYGYTPTELRPLTEF